MLLSEIKEKNDEILKQALMIQQLLSNYNELNIPIEKCDNAILYYMATASLSAQKKAPMGEKFLCNKLNLKQIPSREDRGDAVDENGIYYEFKNSFTNEAKNLNIRQIRLWQDIDFYICFYINEENLDDSIFFKLTKQEMEEEVELCGGYTHGTIQANAVNQHSEYSITIPIYNDKNEKTKRWKKKYLSPELKERILYGN